MVGMGTWITFDVGTVPHALRERQRVLLAFFKLGGQLVDSSPMYGSSQRVLGHCLENIGGSPPLFSATKVWTPGRSGGINQMHRSAGEWGLPGFDLMMVHNMVDWETHLETLQGWKADGSLRYHGISTSHGRRHRDFERVITGQPFDFVQFTYNIFDRRAEQRLLPLSAEHGKAVIINRPFKAGALFDRVGRQPLPAWAGEIGVDNWAQYFLKFVVSHPAVTVAIPATSQVEHMQENMGALQGPMPDADMRAEMIRYFERVSA